MKKALSIILIITLVFCLFSCNAKDADDIAMPDTEPETTQKEDEQITQDPPPSVVYGLICVIEDDFIAIELLDDRKGIRINMDTSKHDFFIYDEIGLKDNLTALSNEESYTYDGAYNKTLKVGYTAEYEDIVDFGFDPDNIDGIATVELKCPGFVIASYKSRPIIVKSANYNDFNERDTIMLCGGKATLLEVPLEYNYRRHTQVKYEVTDAKVSRYYIEDEAGGEILGAKPVIYLYPEKKTEVSVFLNVKGKLTCVYPDYNGLWQVSALPDGTLTDKAGREYYCLYWEAEFDTEFDNDKNTGFVVKGCDTAEFLREKALALGLTEKEANEFIIYWLPQMQDNAYNYIYFATDEYEKKAELNVSPAPDTTIRFMMLFKPLDKKIEVREQILPKAPERYGFTVVEWGGSKLK